MVHIINFKMNKKCLIVVDMVNGFQIFNILDKCSDKKSPKIKFTRKEARCDNDCNENMLGFKKYTSHCLVGCDEELVDEQRLKELINTNFINNTLTCFTQSPELKKVLI